MTFNNRPRVSQEYRRNSLFWCGRGALAVSAAGGGAVRAEVLPPFPGQLICGYRVTGCRGTLMS